MDSQAHHIPEEVIPQEASSTPQLLPPAPANGEEVSELPLHPTPSPAEDVVNNDYTRLEEQNDVVGTTMKTERNQPSPVPLLHATTLDMHLEESEDEEYRQGGRLTFMAEPLDEISTLGDTVGGSITDFPVPGHHLQQLKGGQNSDEAPINQLSVTYRHLKSVHNPSPDDIPTEVISTEVPEKSASAPVVTKSQQPQQVHNRRILYLISVVMAPILLGTVVGLSLILARVRRSNQNDERGSNSLIVQDDDAFFAVPSDAPDNGSDTLLPTSQPSNPTTVPLPTAAPSTFKTAAPSTFKTGSTPAPNLREPTRFPTFLPTVFPHPFEPTDLAPSLSNTMWPSEVPAVVRTSPSPTAISTNSPTNSPTLTIPSPVLLPTQAPIRMTERPTTAPTFPVPTKSPTMPPTVNPITPPTAPPTSNPPVSAFPTPNPVAPPTSTPMTPIATDSPTKKPTRRPTDTPTTEVPTVSPTMKPTRRPTNAPTTTVPTVSPTMKPTQRPTNAPILIATPSPTKAPTSRPTEVDTTTASLPEYPDFRFTIWTDLSDEQKETATALGYTVDTWNYPRTAVIEQLSYAAAIYMDFANRENDRAQQSATTEELLLEIGFDDPFMWNCWVNHFRFMFWEEIGNLQTSDASDYGLQVQAAYTKLGWTQATWDRGSPPPSEFKSWSNLSSEEQEGATFVCFTQHIWDREFLGSWC